MDALPVTRKSAGQSKNGEASIRRRDEERDMDREMKAGYASRGRFRSGRDEE
jgi:hypothetical protein